MYNLNKGSDFSGILILEPEGFSVKVIDKLKARSENVFFGLDDATHCDIVDVIFVRLSRYIDTKFVNKFKNLKFIVSPTTGYTHFSSEILNSQSFKVLTLKNKTNELSAITSTPELAWGLMLSLVRNIPSANCDVIKGNWCRDKFKGKQISGLKIGIIGFGRVGQKLAEYAKAFGSEVVWTDLKNVTCDPDLLVRQVDLCTIASSCDVIFVTASYTLGDKYIIDKNFLSEVKRKPFIINVSRANLLDEEATLRSLEMGRISGVAADVIDGDEIMDIQTSRLWRAAKMMQNVLLTPHIGGCTTQGMEFTEALAADLLFNELSGEE
ncbi:hypothetical protein N9W92_00990 [Planktomarina temperata]|nr:hypothetical protein [Planktomarina temperata]MDB2459780.1 hypothetical protein [Planktomarina temperata]